MVDGKIKHQMIPYQRMHMNQIYAKSRRGEKLSYATALFAAGHKRKKKE